MILLKSLVATGLSFMFLAAVFIPLEKAFPARKAQPVLRPHWMLDSLYFVGQYLLWNGTVVWLLSCLDGFVGQMVPVSLHTMVGRQPLWLQCTAVIILSDLLVYWGHRLQHSVEFLWRFHKVHHSTEHLDWLAAHREHPLDSIFTVGLINLPAFILGVNLEALVLLIAFRGIWAIYIHSNVRINLGVLKMLIGSPDLHHWHHDIDRHAGNYANISPLVDKLFGTYSCPPHEPAQFGINEELPDSYAGQLLEPMLPKRKGKRSCTGMK